MTVILGLDPGSSSTGWALVDTRGGAGRPIITTYLDAGAVASTAEMVAGLLSMYSPDAVAVEKLEGIAYASKGPGIVAGLVSSAHAAGVIVGVASALGHHVEQLTARDWRRLVLGQPAATDQQIARVIPTLVRGWPKRSNVHERDAGGVALAIAWRRNGQAGANARARE